jgi:hypothetical protein
MGGGSFLGQVVASGWCFGKVSGVVVDPVYFSFYMSREVISVVTSDGYKGLVGGKGYID